MLKYLVKGFNYNKSVTTILELNSEEYKMEIKKSYQMGKEDRTGTDPNSVLDAISSDYVPGKTEAYEASNKERVYSGVPVEDIGILSPGVKILNTQKKYSEGELGNPTSYMETNFSRLERNIEKIREVFAGRVVVDLGAGDNDWGYYLADMAGAKHYVGVDSHNARGLNGQLEKFSEEIKEGKFIPYSVVDTDMLSFLRDVKDDSVSMIASGIDDYIIEDGKYSSETSREISRTLHPEGGLLSVMSSIHFPEKTKRTVIGDDSSYLGYQIAILRK